MHQRFFHADRACSLVAGQEIHLNNQNLSTFGSVYWHAMSTKQFDDLTPQEQREYVLEEVRSSFQPYQHYASRMQSFFGSNRIEDALIFAEDLLPKPINRIPIYEVYADQYWSFDMTWTDHIGPINLLREYAHKYWQGAITNHESLNGDKRAPCIEVMMRLPIQIGQVVSYV
jgi:hypothetical protein